MSDIKTDYFDLKSLQGLRGYQKLQALWAHEYSAVMLSLQKVAAKNNESNWRYQAGILKGFDLAIGQLERALVQMERDKDWETEDTPASKTVKELLEEIRGTKGE